MRSFAILAFAAATVLAQDISSLPTCAQGCVGSSFGSCASLDIKCICSNTNLISGLACCVAKTCSAAEQEGTIKFAESLCKGAGVTNLPTAASCPSSSGSAAAATSGAGNATSSSPVTSSMPATSSMAGTKVGAVGAGMTDHHNGTAVATKSADESKNASDKSKTATGSATDSGATAGAAATSSAAGSSSSADSSTNSAHKTETSVFGMVVFVMGLLSFRI